MSSMGSREGAAYGTAAAAVAVAVCIGLLSSCSVERAAAPTSTGSSATAAYATR